MSIEDILKSNGIDLSVKLNSSTDSANKLYTVTIQNHQLNTTKTFDIDRKKDLYVEDVLPLCFNRIYLFLLDLLEYTDLDGNIIKDLGSAEEYLRPQMKMVTSLKRDLEEVLSNCMPDILKFLASSKNPFHRGYAAFSPVCPKEIIRELLVDEVSCVREVAMKHLHAKDFAAFV